MNVARRTLFQFVGGAAAGVAFTPIPWRSLWESATWTQNWSWIPKLAHGEPKTKFTTCTLCPASCPMKVRCAGDQPVGLTGVAATVESNGALCPVGLAAHHLPYHPKRAVKPFHRVRQGAGVTPTPVTREQAVELVAQRLKALPAGQSVVILDERPGRVTSDLYEKLAAKLPSGRYATAPQTEGGTLAAVETLGGAPAAFDLSQAKLVLSIGTPVLDGWGTPGRVFQNREHFRLIQVEPVLSRTAAAADQWLPIRPGTEAAFALGLMHQLGKSKLAEQWTPEKTQAVTGIPAAEIVSIARELTAAQGVLVIADGDPGSGPFAPEEQQLFAALNLMLKNALASGAASRRQPSIEALADGSIGVLLCDAASSGATTPWRMISKKLAPGALVVSLSPYLEGFGRYAELVVPAPAFLESLQEATAAPDARMASFALAPALIPAREGTTEPVEFLSALAGEPLVLADALKQKVEALHKAGKGEVVNYADSKATAVKEFKTADDLWKALNDGGVWQTATTASPYKAKPAEVPVASVEAVERRMMNLNRPDPARPLTLIATALRASTGNAQVSPVLTKVYQESGNRAGGNTAALHPATCRQLDLEDGSLAVLTTACGSCNVRIAADAGVMPGVVAGTIGPTVESISAQPRNASATLADICAPEGDAPWRVTRAQLRRA